MDVLDKIITKIVNPVVLLLTVVAFGYFIWGVYVSFIYKGGPGDRQTGSNHLLWGLLGLVIMISVFTLIQFIARTIGVSVPASVSH